MLLILYTSHHSLCNQTEEGNRHLPLFRTFVSLYDTKCCWICTHSYRLVAIYSRCGMNAYAIYMFHMNSYHLIVCTNSYQYEFIHFCFCMNSYTVTSIWIHTFSICIWIHILAFMFEFIYNNNRSCSLWLQQHAHYQHFWW